MSIKGRGPTADDCAQARALLDDIAAGKVLLPEVSPLGALPECSTRGEHPVFALTSEHDWGQDSDQAVRIRDERTADDE